MRLGESIIVLHSLKAFFTHLASPPKNGILFKQKSEDHGIQKESKEPEQPHFSRFLSRKHEKYFKVVQDRRLLMEKKVGMIPNFAPQIREQLLGRNWGKLATYPAPANIAMVKEFYTNARKIGDYPAEDYLGYVRGHAIRYDPNSINSFLGTEWVGEQCQFALCMEEGIDFDDVESVLCVLGGHFHLIHSHIF
ncbi:hypothetical protein LR48_Vigan233s002800 [Vigna angularis]|uniref:Putative plant transposon protein domain-containing protein n=1 Tax=Phaseolus angularis TaxID=3914 RepID=A0A0L9T738_PHAAN|nr:hypothetical protein LR48_Vigan233s002800 [Vigna angularis]